MATSNAPKQVTVTIFTTITIIFWIFLGIYRILTSTLPPEIDTKLLEPINPQLDEKILNNLEEKIFFEEGQVEFPYVSEKIIPKLIPTPILTKTISPTPYPTINEEENAEVTPEEGV